MTASARSTLTFPAGAAALGIVLFSADMREAFVSGSLVVLAAVFALLLKSAPGSCLPPWSLRAVLWIGTGALSACVFSLGFHALAMERTAGSMVMQGIVGILAGEEIYRAEEDTGDVLWEGAVIWAFWIGAGLLRELLGAGTVFGFGVAELSLASAAFGKTMFAFLGAGMVLALSCLVLGKSCGKFTALFAAAPVFFYRAPFTLSFAGGLGGALLPALGALVLFLSVRRQQQGTTKKEALEGLPSELISAGIIYMILSVY